MWISACKTSFKRGKNESFLHEVNANVNFTSNENGTAEDKLKNYFMAQATSACTAR